MAKTKTAYLCQNCGATYLKWQGQCSNCKEWNTLVEEIVSKKAKGSIPGIISKPSLLKEIEGSKEERFPTPDAEMNRVLGGGIVTGGVVLLGGEPGIGKSTLLLQLALQMEGVKILYISGEESEQQIKMRAERIDFHNDQLYIGAMTELESIIAQVERLQPSVLVIDSIQTMHSANIESAPGSVSQVRECTGQLIRLAKTMPIPIFLVGHITKEGMIAGPKVLEHMVDTVLSFEGDRHNSYRIVRTQKNRFGSTLEMGIYEMLVSGLRQVANPSEIFLSEGEEIFSGVAVAATMEGMRPLLIETQALVANTAYSTAQRSATGFDLRRLNMLLAVLEKRSNIPLGQKDVFINMVGGMRIEDPALDLSVIISIVSSLHDIPLQRGKVFSAEVGLSGEIRPISKVESRIAEAEKLGFEEIYISANQAYSLSREYRNIKVIGLQKLEEAFKSVFA